MVRGTNQASWGGALLKVMAEASHLWQDRRELLLPRRFVQPNPQPVNPKQPAGPKAGVQQPPGQFNAAVPPTPPKVPNNEVPSRKRWATAKVTTQNWTICKKYNDGRGCAGKSCADGHAHVCDVILAATKKPCQQKDHTRATHDAARHGMPATIR